MDIIRKHSTMFAISKHWKWRVIWWLFGHQWELKLSLWQPVLLPLIIHEVTVGPLGNSILSSRKHYDDVKMGTMASQITSLTIVYSTVYSGADQRKHQSSASLAFVRGIHRGPVNSPHKWPVTRKMFPLFDDVIMDNLTFQSLPSIISSHSHDYVVIDPLWWESIGHHLSPLTYHSILNQ